MPGAKKQDQYGELTATFGNSIVIAEDLSFGERKNIAVVIHEIVIIKK